jgi:hypothetical protein
MATRKILQVNEGKFNAHKYFNMKLVSTITGINQDKIYNNLKGEYDSFTDQDKKQIAAALIPAVKSFFKLLGYAVEFTASNKKAA